MWDFQIFQENYEILNQNRASGGPPFGPPFSFLKNTNSQLSLEKKNRKKILKTRNFTLD